jgi:hypothetical protein
VTLVAGGGRRQPCPRALTVSQLAEVAERLGVPLHPGDRVRFEVIEGGADQSGPARREPWPPTWVGSIITDDEHLAEHARTILRAELGEQ